MKAESASIKKKILLLAMGIVVALYTIQSSSPTSIMLQGKLQNMVIENDLFASR